jgi:hypothetical protein
VAVQHLGLVLVPGGGRPVRVDDQGPAPAVDGDLVVEGAKEYAVLMDVGPPSALCRVWCTWHASAGWSHRPAHWQCLSRSSTALRIPAGTVSAYPMSSGRPGPPSRAPSWRRRRNDASPPGPDSRSTALPIVLLMHTDMTRVHIDLATRDPRTLEDPIDQQTSGQETSSSTRSHRASIPRERHGHITGQNDGDPNGSIPGITFCLHPRPRLAPHDAAVLMCSRRRREGHLAEPGADRLWRESRAAIRDPAQADARHSTRQYR